MKTGSCYQTTSSCSCRYWALENNKSIWKLRWDTVSLYHASLQRERWKYEDKEPDDHGGTPQITTNTDTAACLGYSLGLTMPFVLRSPGMCCVGTGTVREREREIIFSCRQAKVKVFCNHTQTTETDKKTVKKPYNFCCQYWIQKPSHHSPLLCFFPSFVLSISSQNSLRNFTICIN